MCEASSLFLSVHDESDRDLHWGFTSKSEIIVKHNDSTLHGAIATFDLVHIRRDQSASQETRCLFCSSVHKGRKQKAPEVESPSSVKHLWTTLTLESCPFTITRPPNVSLLIDIILPHCYCKRQKIIKLA